MWQASRERLPPGHLINAFLETRIYMFQWLRLFTSNLPWFSSYIPRHCPDCSCSTWKTIKCTENIWQQLLILLKNGTWGTRYLNALLQREDGSVRLWTTTTCYDWDWDQICTPIAYDTEDLDKYGLTIYSVKFIQDQTMVLITFLTSMS